MESREARQSGWLTRSTVRSLRPGTYFDLIGLPHDPANPKAEHQYLAADITHVGINNLSGEAIAAIAQHLGQGHLTPDDTGLATGAPLYLYRYSRRTLEIPEIGCGQRLWQPLRRSRFAKASAR
ncbi:hypothetical protein AB6Q56_07290 [Dechloromonas sp. ARDL1]|uniref:hypothetical protein n=1 Tax=Dechloromonas sp. ARDL1 TaxID=3322121 RepID=UPI003DA70D16